MAEVRVEDKMEEGANYCHYLSACCDCLFLPFAFLASQPSPMHSPAQHPSPIIAQAQKPALDQRDLSAVCCQLSPHRTPPLLWDREVI